MMIATPALWYPGQTDQEWQEELDAMIVRSRMTSDFLQGRIDAETFLDFLAETYCNPFDVAEEWEECPQFGDFSSLATGG